MSKTQEPNGGFPPIYICDEKISEKEQEQDTSDEMTKREFKTQKKTISIRELMEKRREKNPLLNK